MSDSAGVRLVRHADLFDADLPRWTVDSVSLATVGESANLYRVRGAFPLGDSVLVIANGSSREVRLYGSDGLHIRSFGREGDGPREFAVLTSIGRIRGDSIAVFDRPSQRLSIFGATGGLGRTQGLQQDRGTIGNDTVMAWLEDGSPVLRAEAFGSSDGGATRFDNTVHVRTVEGADDIIGVFPGREYWFSPPTGTHVEFGPAEFGRDLLVAAGTDVVYVMDTAEPVLRAYTPAGSLSMKVSDAAPPEPITTAHRETLVRGWAERFDREITDQLREVILGRVEHETLPEAGRLLVAGNGDVWLGGYRVEGEDSPRRYTVLRPDGSLRAQVRIPADYELLWAGEDRVVVLARNELDVERVEMLALRREE